ncbi:MAG: copper chaperone PCu(A)C [Betaproteobacteria bacterium]|nr:copper chaperone PCu(A)C [Betaproteobacteria bacterium]
MHRRLNLLWFAAWVFAAGQAWADVIATDVWVSASGPKDWAAAVFMKLRSGEDTSLVNAASPAAGIVQIQEPAKDGGVAAMRSIDDVALPAGRTVELKPGGYQVMLMELVKPLTGARRSRSR